MTPTYALQDHFYLSPLIAEIEAEIAEREHLDSVIVERKK
jgi:carbamoylphosphate synthase large subunit